MSTYLRYIGDGTTTNFVVPTFDEEYSNLIVTLDKAETTQYSFLNSNTIKLSNAPEEGVVIEVYRQTKSDNRLVDYQNGSILNESELDKDSNQLFYLIQENKGYADRILNDLTDRIDQELELNRGGENYKEYFVATEGQTNFSVSQEYLEDIEDVNVFINGVYQNSNTYSIIDTTTLSLNVGVKLNDIVEIIYGKKYTEIITSVNWNNVLNKPEIVTEKDNLGGLSNIKIGEGSLSNNETGSNNIGIGEDTLNQIVDTDNNIAIGNSSQMFNSNGSSNCSLGAFSLFLTTNGSENTSIGDNTLRSNTTGNYNTAVGSKSQYTSSTNSYNTSLGYRTLYNNTSNYNTAIGYKSLEGNTSGNQNTGLGYRTLEGNITGDSNTALGYNTLKSSVGDDNTAVGSNSLQAVVSGINNTSVGSMALYFNIGGENNTAVGKYALGGQTTGSNNTAVGMNALINSSGYSQCTGLGYGSSVTGSNQIQLGTFSETTYAYGAIQDRSDKRDKLDIKETSLGINFIKSLNPVEYRWNHRERYITTNTKGETIKLENDGSKAGKRFHQGFIAQEVKEVIDTLGVDFGGYQDHSLNGGEDVKSLGYTEFIPPMVKAIQELCNKVEELENRIKILEEK